MNSLAKRRDINKKTVTLLTVSALIAVAGCQVDPGVAIDGFTGEFVTTSLNGTSLGEVQLSWNEPTNNRVYSYAIYHKSGTTSSPRQLVNSTSASSGSYTHNPAEISQDDTYSYKLVALTVMGEEVEQSDWMSVQVEAGVHPRVPFVETNNYKGQNAIQALNAIETELDSILIDDGTYDIEVYLESTYGDQVERSNSVNFSNFTVALN